MPPSQPSPKVGEGASVCITFLFSPFWEAGRGPHLPPSQPSPKVGEGASVCIMFLSSPFGEAGRGPHLPPSQPSPKVGEGASVYIMFLSSPFGEAGRGPPYYLYSSQLLIAISSSVSLQKAIIKALATLEFVRSGILKSTALRRIE